MNAPEAVMLCRFTKACCPQQHFDDWTPEAWGELLGDLSLDAAKDAVLAVARRQPFVSPAEIRVEVARVRRERIAGLDAVQPPAEIEAIDDPDEFDRAYRGWIGRIREKAAAGEQVELEERTGPWSVSAAVEAIRQELTA